MRNAAPKIDERSFQKLVDQIRSKLPFYTPEWVPTRNTEPGEALIRIYSHMLEQVIDRLNRVPDNNLIAFLDMLGTRMLPAQSAHAWVTFSLAEGTTEHVTVSEGTELAGEGAVKGTEATFQTLADLRVTPSKIQEVITFAPSTDEVFAHTPELLAGHEFRLFAGSNLQEHSFYIGHTELLNQKSPSNITISFALAKVATSNLMNLAWEYWSGERWTQLARFDPKAGGSLDDTTDLLSKSGDMKLSKNHTGEFPILELYGMKSRWLRCRLVNLLDPGALFQLPKVQSLHLSVAPKAPFSPELAFNNDVSLDLTSIGLEMQAISSPLVFVRKDEHNEITITGQVELGDILKLHNSGQEPEQFEVKQIVVKQIGNQLTIDPSLLFAYPPRSTIELVTALRPNKDVVAVKVPDGVTIDPGSALLLVYSVGKEPERARVKSIVRKAGDIFTLTLDRNARYLYAAGDTAWVTPQIKPFGKRPKLFDVFYVASDEAFSKKKALVTLEIDATCNGDNAPGSPLSELDAVLSWEYWNGQSWQLLQAVDATDRFRKPGKVTFTCPSDLGRIKVNGEEKLWVRARIIDGDYGKELKITPNPNGKDVTFAPGTVHFPTINELTISYQGEYKKPEQCFTLNNLNFEDQAVALSDSQGAFEPFAVFPDDRQSVFFGFDKPLEGGPISILFDLQEQVVPQDQQTKLAWSYWNGAQWSELNVIDGTEQLTQIGLLQLLAPDDMTKKKLFDKELFWIKGSVSVGQFADPRASMINDGPVFPYILGLHLNTTEAVQASIVKDEILGASNLAGGQQFRLLNSLIISQEIVVIEPARPTEEEQAEILREEGPTAIQPIEDPARELSGFRVRWHEVKDFDGSGPNSRHYVLDKGRGILKFGDGVHGMVPPFAPNNIRASYTFGGGKVGNVLPGKITSLKNALPFVTEVTNYLPADGGSESETIEDVVIRGTQHLKNRGRAVTNQDFEALAKQASRKVARAKCLPLTNEIGETESGHVSIIIVPDTQKTNEPISRLLRKVVTDYLEQQAANLLSPVEHIHVRGADYAEIVVHSTIVPASLEAASRAEAGVRSALERYLHPLTGGASEQGWDFGQPICRSEITGVLERVKDVDHVEELTIWVDGVRNDDHIVLGEHVLPYSGEHKVKLMLGTNTVVTPTVQAGLSCVTVPPPKVLENSRCR